MKVSALIMTTLLVSSSAWAHVAPREILQTIKTPLGKTAADAIVLKNDSFKDEGGQAYLQLGFVEGEKAGVWVKVPATVKKFKVDYFRILYGASFFKQEAVQDGAAFFTMGIAKAYSPAMPVDIENAVSLTPGAYWNDVPAQGANATLACATAGDLIGAALEFDHEGAPSVYRDLDGLGNPQGNTLFAIPGGWNYSVALGLRGDWVLRVVGHEAKDGECQ